MCLGNLAPLLGEQERRWKVDTIKKRSPHPGEEKNLLDERKKEAGVKQRYCKFLSGMQQGSVPRAVDFDLQK